MGYLGFKIFWGGNLTILEKYVDDYILLCSKLCKDSNDYNRSKVQQNNRAYKKLTRLKLEISKDIATALNVYSILLNDQNVFIQQSAATDCLKLNIHIEESVHVLRNISHSTDRMRAISAKRTLLVWEKNRPI